MIDLKNCITVKEAAVELRVSPHTLLRWRMAGNGPRFIKYSKYVYYERAEIEAFKKANAKYCDSTAQAKVEKKHREGKK